MNKLSTHQRARTSPLRRSVILLMTVSTFLGLLAACSSEARDQIGDIEGIGDTDGGEGTDPEAPVEPEEPVEPEQPEPEAPEEPEEPVEPEQPIAPVDPDTPDGVEDGLTSQDWLIIALVGVGAVVLIMVIAGMSANKSEQVAITQRNRQSQVNQVLGGGRWIHDQGAIDVLRVSNDHQLQSLWPSVRSRLVDLENQVAILEGSVGDIELSQQLNTYGHTLAGLRGALEANVGVRLDPAAAAQDLLVANATQSVYDRRRDLQVAMAGLGAAASRGGQR